MRAEERLLAPALRDELGGQPVEQLRMRRRRALRAEVLARLDEPASEDLLPEPIDGDARDERVALVDQPAREAEPVDGLIVAHRMQRAGCARRRRARLWPRSCRARAARRTAARTTARSFITSVDGICRSASAFRAAASASRAGFSSGAVERKTAASSSACAALRSAAGSCQHGPQPRREVGALRADSAASVTDSRKRPMPWPIVPSR